MGEKPYKGLLTLTPSPRAKKSQTYSFTYIQEGSVGVFYIDGETSLTVRIYGVTGKSIMLFAESNSVEFTDLREYTR
jgi:hypothetical protein